MKEYRYSLHNANARASGTEESVAKDGTSMRSQNRLSCIFSSSQTGAQCELKGGGGAICAAESKGQQDGTKNECFKRKKLYLINIKLLSKIQRNSMSHCNLKNYNSYQGMTFVVTPTPPKKPLATPQLVDVGQCWLCKENKTGLQTNGM